MNCLNCSENFNKENKECTCFDCDKKICEICTFYDWKSSSKKLRFLFVNSVWIKEENENNQPKRKAPQLRGAFCYWFKTYYSNSLKSWSVLVATKLTKINSIVLVGLIRIVTFNSFLSMLSGELLDSSTTI